MSKGRKDKTPNSEEHHGTIVVTAGTGNSVSVELFPPGASQSTATGEGTCMEGFGTGRDKPHILTFRLTVGGEPRRFRGIIDPGDPKKIACGSFIVTAGPTDPGDTGTWQATKP